MGVTTTADERIREAREELENAHKNLKSAIDSLEVATAPRTWNDLSYDRVDELEEITDALIFMRRELTKLKNKV